MTYSIKISDIPIKIRAKDFRKSVFNSEVSKWCKSNGVGYSAIEQNVGGIYFSHLGEAKRGLMVVGVRFESKEAFGMFALRWL